MFKNLKYTTTCSMPTMSWGANEQTGVLTPPPVVLPSEEGDWVLMGPATCMTRNGFDYLVWTWADVASIVKAADVFPSFDADLVVPSGKADAEFDVDEETTEHEHALAQENDHRCGISSTGGYQCQYAAHDGVMHYNQACGPFATPLPPGQASSANL